MKRAGPLRRYTPLPKPTSRMRSENPERKAKRRRGYAAHLRSPYFRALRLERFALDGWQCTAENVPMFASGYVWRRCPVMDETQTGKGLHADHLTYARFGHELLEDIRTVCASCHRRRHALQGKRISA